jgi:hypothetical protein
MKKWTLILALFLCLIAVGGLAVIFRTDKSSSPSDNSSFGGNGGNGGYESEVEGIDLNETNLIF